MLHSAQPMSRRATLLLLILMSLPAAAARRRAVDRRPLDPPCTMVTGTAAVTFTRNHGRTLAPSAERGRPVRYTWGLATMIDRDDALAAWHGDDLLLSTDGGCSWRVEATINGTDFSPRLEPARGGRVYAWSENREFFVRYDDRGAVKLRQPVAFLGLTADAQNGERIRAGGTDGTLWESLDGGTSWTPLGRLNGAPGYYRFAFDPHDLDHVVAGTVSNGAFVSLDAGRTWVKSTGIAKGNANVFQLLFADSARVWAMGIDLDESGSGHPSHGRHIYVSDDGGASYRPVVDEAPGVKLINGPTMAADPADRDVLYFVFGTHIYDYGTDLFRLDLRAGALTMEHNDRDDVNAIAFSRRTPSVMYLGLEIVR